MRSFLFIVVLLSLGISNHVNAQIIPSMYMHKNLRIHTDTCVIEISIIDEAVNFTPHKNLVYHWYQNRQIFKNQGGIAGNVLDGKYLCFDLSGRLIEEGQFNKGLKVGTWKQWNNRGKLIEVGKWKNGMPHGKWLVYSVNDSTMVTKTYRWGKHKEKPGFNFFSFKSLNKEEESGHKEKEQPINEEEQVTEPDDNVKDKEILEKKEGMGEQPREIENKSKKEPEKDEPEPKKRRR